MNDDVVAYPGVVASDRDVKRRTADENSADRVATIIVRGNMDLLPPEFRQFVHGIEAGGSGVADVARSRACSRLACDLVPWPIMCTPSAHRRTTSSSSNSRAAGG